MKVTIKTPIIHEARRLARDRVKDQIRRQGIRISHVRPEDITKAALALVETDLLFLAEAQRRIEGSLEFNATVTIHPSSSEIVETKSTIKKG